MRHVYYQWKYTRDFFQAVFTDEDEFNEFMRWAEKEKGVVKLHVHDSPPIYRKDD